MELPHQPPSRIEISYDEMKPVFNESENTVKLTMTDTMYQTMKFGQTVLVGSNQNQEFRREGKVVGKSPSEKTVTIGFHEPVEQQEPNERIKWLFGFLHSRIDKNKLPYMFPLTIQGRQFTISNFEKTTNELEFGLFIGDKRYSRKSLIVDELGRVGESAGGVLPDFDKVEDEPDFSTISNEEIVNLILEEYVKKLSSD